MNTTQLECFIEVASTLSFAQAALRLNMTQPAVSKQIKSLETELSTRLFERTTRSVALTPAGESFLPDANEMLSLMRDSTLRAQRTRDDQANTINVGYTDTAELVALSKVWRQMRSKGIKVHPVLRRGLQDENVNAVAQGKLDVALGVAGLLPDVDGTKFDKLCDSTLRCVLSPRNKYAARGKVSLAELDGMGQIICAPSDLRRQGSESLPLPLRTKSEVFICASIAEAASLVAAGLGYTLVPSHLFLPSKGVRAIELAEAINANYGAFTREKERAPIVELFIELLAKHYSTHP